MRRWKIKVGQIVACSFCGEWFKFHFRVTPGRGGGYGGGFFFEMQFYDRPLRRAEDDKGYAAAGLVLLVAHQFRVLERSPRYSVNGITGVWAYNPMS